MSVTSALATGRQMLGLETKAKAKLEAVAKAAVASTKDQQLLSAATQSIGDRIAAEVVTIRAATRSAAAKQFSKATGLDVKPSGTDDTERGDKAAAHYVKAFTKALPAAYGGGGGTSGGGGSTDSWGDAVEQARVDATSALNRVAAYEVAHAWNDEHRRNVDALPQWRFRERWFTQRDKFVCLACRRMNGRYADVRGHFAGGQYPPQHAGCRCFIVTTVIGAAKPHRIAARDLDMPRPHLLDLGVSDVHQPGATTPRKRTMAKLPNAKITKALGKKPKAGVKKAGRRLHVRADLAAGGSLHVRHMSDGAECVVRMSGQSLAMGDEVDPKSASVTLKGPALYSDGTAKKLVWVNLAVAGYFKGHRSGPFELNDTVFQQIKTNFERAGIPVAFDMEHASESDPTEGSIPITGAPAHGWIHRIAVRATGLWGLTEWLDYARNGIKAGQFGFVSPAIRFNAKDRVSGENVGARLTSAALTNGPFLSRLAPPMAASDRPANATTTNEPDIAEPVVASDIQSTTMRLAFSPAEYMPRIRSILCLSELSTAAECADQLERLRQHFDAAGQDPDASHEGIPLCRFVLPLRSMVAMNMGHTWDDVFDCVAEMIAAASGDVDDDDDLEEPTETLTDDENGAAMRDTTNLNDAGITAGENAMSAEKIAELSTKNAELSVSLKDATTKLTAAETAAAETVAKVADLTLSLKDETAKRETAEAELKTLRDKDLARETKDLTDRVALAFDTYKDAQKLTDDDKETMLIVLKAKPESFEKKYPKVAATQQHLMRNLSDKRETTIPTTSDDAGGTVINMADAAKQLAHQRGISLGDAQRIVYRAAHTKPAH